MLRNNADARWCSPMLIFRDWATCVNPKGQCCPFQYHDLHSNMSERHHFICLFFINPEYYNSAPCDLRLHLKTNSCSRGGVMEALCGEMFFSGKGISKRCCANSRSQWNPLNGHAFLSGRSLARPRGSTNQALRCAEKRRHWLENFSGWGWVAYSWFKVTGLFDEIFFWYGCVCVCVTVRN